jgi:hypothetical protein
LAYSLAQLDALEAAIATGTLRVTAEGRTIEYRSLAEMKQIRDDMRGALMPANKRPAVTFATFSSGRR